MRKEGKKRLKVVDTYGIDFYPREGRAAAKGETFLARRARGP